MDNQKGNNKEFAAEIQGLAIDTLLEKREKFISDMRDLGKKAKEKETSADDLEKVVQGMQDRRNKIEMIDNLIGTKQKLAKLDEYAQKEQELEKTIDANENNGDSNYKMAGGTREELEENAQCRDEGLEVPDGARIITMFGKKRPSRWCTVSNFAKAYNTVFGGKRKPLCRDSSRGWDNATHRRFNKFISEQLPIWFGMTTYKGDSPRRALSALQGAVGGRPKVQFRDVGDGLNTVDDLTYEQLRTLVSYAVQDRLTEYSPIFDYIDIEKVKPAENSGDTFFVQYLENDGTYVRMYREGEKTIRGKSSKGSQQIKLRTIRAATSPFTWEAIISNPAVVIDDLLRNMVYRAAIEINKMIYSPVWYANTVPEALTYTAEDKEFFDFKNFGLASVHKAWRTASADKITYADLISLHDHFCSRISMDQPEPLLLMEAGVWNQLHLDTDAINRRGDLVSAIESGTQFARSGGNSDLVIPGYKPDYYPAHAINLGGSIVPVLPIRGIDSFFDFSLNSQGEAVWDPNPKFSRATLDLPLMTMVNQHAFKMGIVDTPNLTVESEMADTLTIKATFIMRMAAYVVNPKANGCKLLPAVENLIDDDDDNNNNNNNIDDLENAFNEP